MSNILLDQSLGHLGRKLVHPVGHLAKPERYARLVQSVLYDVRLSHSDVRVFAALAYHVWQGTVAKVGQRAIARDLGMSRTTVGASLKHLIACGHIEPAGSGQNSVQMYHLTSKTFGQKQRSGVEEVVSSPSRGPRLASVRKSA